MALHGGGLCEEKGLNGPVGEGGLSEGKMLNGPGRGPMRGERVALPLGGASAKGKW